ncbi:substrate-binding periplasmic protein [Bacterioplanoides sp.]|uniref:substrate-binding periplasmic protein n=1 Tax=Bacterioplanoides sp. TaxID=2066072 RepID=UPI003AFF6E8C
MRKLITGLLFLFCISSHAETITAAQDPWPPFIYEDGQSGLSVELARAALASQGYQLELKILPWSRALNEVRKANIDLLIATWKTTQRNQFLYFSDSYISNRITFISRASTPFEYDGLLSLMGKSVGVARNYGYDDAFSQATHFNRYEAYDLTANLKKLARDRIDLTLDDEIAARALMKSQGFHPQDFHFSQQPLSQNPLYVSSGISNPRGQQLINAFNRGLQTIKENGTYATILKKYGM